MGPASTAMGPMLVPKELLPRAIAWNSLAWQGGSILGPALGGLLVAKGAGLSYSVTTVLYVVAAVCIVGKSSAYHVTEALRTTLDEGVAMIADYDTGTGTTHQIVVFDGTKLESKPLADEPSGVRWARDGGSLVVSLRSGDVSIRSADGATERARIPKAASDNTVGVLVHPTSPYAYVSGEGKLRVYDLVAGKIVFESGGDVRGPEFQLTSMARLPYAPRRVLAGQSDPGNNWTQARLVEIPDGQIAPAKIELRSWNNLDVGSVSSIAPLFAEPL